jgi:hypothetical protein
VQDDTSKLKALRAEVQRGIAALGRGEATDIEDGELERFLSSLGERRPRSSGEE